MSPRMMMMSRRWSSGVDEGNMFVQSVDVVVGDVAVANVAVQDVDAALEDVVVDRVPVEDGEEGVVVARGVVWDSAAGHFLRDFGREACCHRGHAPRA